MSTLALALPEKASSVVKPKPTRAEVIDAMVAIRLEQIKKEQTEGMERRNKVEARVTKLLFQYQQKNRTKLPATVSLGWKGCDKEICSVYVSYPLKFEKLPDEIKKLLAEFHELPSKVHLPNENEVRKEIRDGLNGVASRDERVQALIDSPDSRKALEAMLKQIDGE